jgi:hypothetical protein
MWLSVSVCHDLKDVLTAVAGFTGLHLRPASHCTTSSVIVSVLELSDVEYLRKGRHATPPVGLPLVNEKVEPQHASAMNNPEASMFTVAHASLG